MIYLGTYKHTIDSKNRLVLPAKFVAKLSKEIVVSKGFDGCLELRSIEDFNSFSEKLMQLSQNKKDTRIVTRQLLANAIDLEIDNVKRILIPSNLMAEANLTKNVVIIGVGNKIEIWDENQYESFKTESDKTYELLAEKIDETK
ncbi:transcriptional regulator MraZ [Bacilli bacterium]|nr:transcriptional regulator MraZ [Bacilli bacterium]